MGWNDHVMGPGYEHLLEDDEPTCTGICRCGPCNDCVPQEPRASIMPPHLPTVDPLFIHGVFNEFTPDEKALLEKAGRG